MQDYWSLFAASDVGIDGTLWDCLCGDSNLVQRCELQKGQRPLCGEYTEHSSSAVGHTRDRSTLHRRKCMHSGSQLVIEYHIFQQGPGVLATGGMESSKVIMAVIFGLVRQSSLQSVMISWRWQSAIPVVHLHASAAMVCPAMMSGMLSPMLGCQCCMVVLLDLGSKLKPC